MKMDGKYARWLAEVEVVVNFLKLFRHKGKEVSELSVYKTAGYYPLKPKRRLLYLKTQSVPHCKHFTSRL